MPLDLDPARGSFLAPPVRDRAWTLSASPKRDRSGSGSVLVSSRRRRAGGKAGNIPMFSTFPRASPDSTTQPIALLKKGGKSPPDAPARFRSGGFPTPALPDWDQGTSKMLRPREGGETGKSPLPTLLRVSGAGVFLPPLFQIGIRQRQKWYAQEKEGGQESPPSWRSCAFQERGFSYPRSSSSGSGNVKNGTPKRRREDRKVPCTLQYTLHGDFTHGG